MMPFERLIAWQRSHDLVLAIYQSTRVWPVEERYGLTIQARRAAVSVTANLAEGSARLGGRELRRFADIGLGSLSELACLLRIARDLEYISAEEFVRLDGIRNSTGKILLGLARAVGKSTPR
jgi:four helix bundle protein